GHNQLWILMLNRRPVRLQQDKMVAAHLMIDWTYTKALKKRHTYIFASLCRKSRKRSCRSLHARLLPFLNFYLQTDGTIKLAQNMDAASAKKMDVTPLTTATKMVNMSPLCDLMRLKRKSMKSKMMVLGVLSNPVTMNAVQLAVGTFIIFMTWPLRLFASESQSVRIKVIFGGEQADGITNMTLPPSMLFAKPTMSKPPLNLGHWGCLNTIAWNSNGSPFIFGSDDPYV
ncbi:hypothetical protein M8C21_007923, partial [Ambrosia artemisiifolia]